MFFPGKKNRISSKFKSAYSESSNVDIFKANVFKKQMRIFSRTIIAMRNYFQGLLRPPNVYFLIKYFFKDLKRTQNRNCSTIFSIDYLRTYSFFFFKDYKSNRNTIFKNIIEEIFFYGLFRGSIVQKMLATTKLGFSRTNVCFFFQGQNVGFFYTLKHNLFCQIVG